MAALSPTEALNACESALRELMSHAYAGRYGGGWLERISTEKQRTHWSDRAQEEAKRRRSVVTVPAVGLEYSEFYELVAFAREHWEPLAAALGKQGDVLPLLETFENLRNTVAHGRQLHTYEADLYSGIAGTIRNQVTIYMSSQDDAGEYYPRISSASDSFGNQIIISTAPLPLGLAGLASEPDQVLRPGDVVVFTAAGVDPQDRDLEWDFRPDGDSSVQVTTSPGEPAVWAWKVEEAHVGENTGLWITMSAKGARYHRASRFDHRVRFQYRVRPPLDS